MNHTLCELPEGRIRPSTRINSQPSQKESWCNVYGHPDYRSLLGQIFFKTDDAALDSQDLAQLKGCMDYLVGYMHRNNIEGDVIFKFVGNADSRGSYDYNMRLGQRRADAVKKYVDGRFRPYPRYYSVAESKGEGVGLSPSLAGARRVDIFTNFIISRDSGMRFDNEIIHGKYDGEKSNKFQFRTLIGAGVGIGPIGGNVVTVEIVNSRTKKKATYTYSGAGVGFGFSFNRPSDWEEKEFPLWLDVDQFEGNGLITSVGAGQQASVLTFKGPCERGLIDKDVDITFSGVDLTLGLSADVEGYWHKR